MRARSNFPSDFNVVDPIARGMAALSRAKLGEFLLITDFGADNTGVRDSYAAFVAGRAAAIAERKTLVFPGGVWTFSQGLDEFAWFEGSVIGQGFNVLSFPDASIDTLITLNGEGLGALSFTMDNFLIEGAGGIGNTQTGVKFHKSQLSYINRLAVRNVGDTAFNVVSDVGTLYTDLRADARGHPTIKPAFGIVIDGEAGGAPNIVESANLTFIRPIIEIATDYGWDIRKCIDTKIDGGTAEGLDGVGMILRPSTKRIQVNSHFFEHNAGNAIGRDVLDYGEQNSFSNLTMASRGPDPGPYDVPPALFVGSGAIAHNCRNVSVFAQEVDAGAVGALFEQHFINYDSVNSNIDNGTGTLFLGLRHGDANDFIPAEERGVSTCALGGSSGDGSITQTGVIQWHRNGNTLTFNATVSVTDAVSWPTGTVLVRTNLPWVAAITSAVTIGNISNVDWPNNNIVYAEIGQDSSNIRFRTTTDNGASDILQGAAAFASGSTPVNFVLSGSYIIKE